MLTISGAILKLEEIYAPEFNETMSRHGRLNLDGETWRIQSIQIELSMVEIRADFWAISAMAAVGNALDLANRVCGRGRQVVFLNHNWTERVHENVEVYVWMSKG